MPVLSDLQTILANAHIERATGLGKQVDILNPDETVKNAALDAIVRDLRHDEVESTIFQRRGTRLFGSIEIDADIVFEVAKQGSFTLVGIEPHLVKVKYPASSGTIYEIVHVETDDVDPSGVATVAVLFGKAASIGIGELST